MVATGRADYPNQVNNVVAFPGIFAGALENNISKISRDMYVKAAYNLANLISEPIPEKIIPSVFDDGVVESVKQAMN